MLVYVFQWITESSGWRERGDKSWWEDKMEPSIETGGLGYVCKCIAVSLARNHGSHGS